MNLAALLLPAIGCTVGPGYALVRRARWGAAETLVGSVFGSLVVVYLASFAVFASGIDLRWNWGITALGWAVTARYARELWVVIRRARTVATAGLVIVAWAAVMQLCVRNYSGAGWVMDWLEHWERARFFRRELPVDWLFIKSYPLPARPPMMNVLSAFAMAHTGTTFMAHQLALAAMNALAFLPCCLMVPRFTRCGRRGVWLAAAAFVLSPAFCGQVVFAWTKLLAAAYCVLAIALYLKAWDRQDARLAEGGRFLAAFVALAGAMLVHYSAGPYVVLLGGHYALWLVWHGRRPVAKLAAAVIVPGALLGSWLAWSAHVYGMHTTLASNTTVVEAEADTQRSGPGRVGYNLLHTIVPHPLSVPREEFDKLFDQRSRLGYLRDYMFVVYQTTLPGAFGLVGWLAVAYWVYRAIGPRGRDRRRTFWRWFLPAVFLIGIAVVGRAEPWGMMHICLAPLMLMGVAMLGAKVGELPRGLRVLVVIGMAPDFVLGVFIHLVAQGRVFTIVGGTQDGGPGRLVPDAATLSMRAVLQYRLKLRNGLEFIGDRVADYQPVLWVIIGVAGTLALSYLAREAFRRRGRATAGAA